MGVEFAVVGADGRRDGERHQFGAFVPAAHEGEAVAFGDDPGVVGLRGDAAHRGPGLPDDCVDAVRFGGVDVAGEDVDPQEPASDGVPDRPLGEFGAGIDEQLGLHGFICVGAESFIRC